MKRRWADIFNLRIKAILVVFIGTILALGIATTVGLLQMRSMIAEAQRKMAQTIAQSASHASELWLGVGDQNHLKQLAEGFLDNDQILFLAIYDQRGKLVAKSVRDVKAWNLYENHGEFSNKFILENHRVEIEDRGIAPELGAGELSETSDAMSASPAPRDAAQALKVMGSITVAVSLAPVQAAQARQSRITAVVSGIAALLSTLVTFLLVGRWARRLKRLVAASQSISEGDFSQAIQDSKNDEVGRLSRAYESMRTAVQYRDKELREFNENLQQLVKDRTRSLEKALSEAESADKAKSLFLANMSHEIRTPLNGVVGMIDLLRKTKLDSTQDRFTQIARSSAESLLNVINDILDFSKIEAGRLELESIRFDLTNVVESVAETISVLASRKNLEVVCNIRPEVPDAVMGDPSRLAQVLTNLAYNAVKFTEQGQIVIGAAVVKDEAATTAIKFWVTDSGIGIPAERRERLFQSFTQMDASTTRKYGGTGLGLAISKRLTELMGGQIGVESEVGSGSTFWLVIPMPKAPSSDDADNAIDAKVTVISTLRNLSVLIVDDNRVNLEILKKNLLAWQLAVTTAEDGATALRLLNEAAASGQPYELAVLDWHMPQMDGLELARRIRSSPAIRDMAMVMLSSVDDKTADTEVASLGFSAYLVKPVRQSKLLDAIALSLGHRSSKVVPPQVARAEGAGDTAGVRLLLAEDNEINRIVASEILSRMGFALDMVESGRQAVQATMAVKYDLILMDCQMPEMDGFEATRAIRKREQETSGDGPKRHIPIVALTANAMRGDREQCLAAGMDDYVPKPIDPDQLLATIQKHMGGRAKELSKTQPKNGPSHRDAGSGDPMVLNMPDFMARCLGNKEIAANVLDVFMQQIDQEIAAIARHISEQNFEQLARIAHRVKGSAGGISAERVRHAAQELERMGKQCEAGGIAAQFEQFKAEVADCIAFIRHGREPGAPDNPDAGPKSQSTLR